MNESLASQRVQALDVLLRANFPEFSTLEDCSRSSTLSEFRAYYQQWGQKGVKVSTEFLMNQEQDWQRWIEAIRAQTPKDTVIVSVGGEPVVCARYGASYYEDLKRGKWHWNPTILHYAVIFMSREWRHIPDDDENGYPELILGLP